MNNDDLVLTASEVGEILGVSARTVARRVEAGELSYIRKLPGPNGDYLFSRTEVNRLLAQSGATS